MTWKNYCTNTGSYLKKDDRDDRLIMLKMQLMGEDKMKVFDVSAGFILSIKPPFLQRRS